MKVWIDQLACTGAGQCELLAPEVFVLGDDGLATVRTPDGHAMADGGKSLGADVRDGMVETVRDAAEVCPGACIHLVKEAPR